MHEHARPISAVMVLMLAGFAQPAGAQPETTPPPGAPSVTAPPPASDAPANADDIGAALVQARAFYRSKVVAERVTLRVSWPDGREVKSTVAIFLDPGDPAVPRTRQIRLELGRLTIAADDHTLTAINSRDPGTFFRAELPEGLTLAALKGLLPPIPLPQVEWALTAGADSTDATKAVAGAGAVAWSTAVSETKTHQMIYSGTASGGAVQLMVDAESGRLVRTSAPYGSAGPSGQARLDVDVTAIPAPEIPALDQWSIQTTGRVPVGFLAELKGRPPEIIPGERLPALSLMTSGLNAWSLQDELNPHPEGPLPVMRENFGVLLIYRVQAAPPSPDAVAGGKAIAALKSLIATRWPDAAKRPRVAGVIVATLDLADFGRTRLGDIDQQWGAAPQRVFSPSGGAILARLAKGAQAALVIVDSDQRVLKAIALDGRQGEDAAIAQEALDTIADAVGPPSEPKPEPSSDPNGKP